MDSEKYYDMLPEKPGKEYTIFLRSIIGKKTREGSIELMFSFYEILDGFEEIFLDRLEVMERE